MPIFSCTEFLYNPTLTASVVIIFYNELLSVILRTVWSVILQTPNNLLHEIILVDDASTDGNTYGFVFYTYVFLHNSYRRRKRPTTVLC